MRPPSPFQVTSGPSPRGPHCPAAPLPARNLACLAFSLLSPWGTQTQRRHFQTISGHPCPAGHPFLPPPCWGLHCHVARASVEQTTIQLYLRELHPRDSGDTRWTTHPDSSHTEGPSPAPPRGTPSEFPDLTPTVVRSHPCSHHQHAPPQHPPSTPLPPPAYLGMQSGQE